MPNINIKDSLHRRLKVISVVRAIKVKDATEQAIEKWCEENDVRKRNKS